MKYYCHDVQTGLLISPDDPADVEYDETLDVWDRMSGAAKSFFGLLSDDDSTLQFRWEEDGTILLDIPYPHLAGSMQRKVEEKNANDLIAEFLKTGLIPHVDDLAFCSW